ncbi:hypothetical protein IC582_010451 [Cucumis melo]
MDQTPLCSSCKNPSSSSSPPIPNLLPQRRKQPLLPLTSPPLNVASRCYHLGSNTAATVSVRRVSSPSRRCYHFDSNVVSPLPQHCCYPLFHGV